MLTPDHIAQMLAVLQMSGCKIPDICFQQPDMAAKVWIAALQGVEPGELEQATMAYLRDRKSSFPTPGQILQYVPRLQVQDRSGEIVELIKMRWCLDFDLFVKRYIEPMGAEQVAATRHAVKQLGGWTAVGDYDMSYGGDRRFQQTFTGSYKPTLEVAHRQLTTDTDHHMLEDNDE